VIVVMMVMMAVARHDDNSPITPIGVVMMMVVILGQLHVRIRLDCCLIDSSQCGSGVWNGL
jgi:hypothetical protein